MEKRTITADDRLRALALATIGNERQREADAFRTQLLRLLGLPEGYGNTKIEEMISGQPFTVADFDQHLAWDGLSIKAGEPDGLR